MLFPLMLMVSNWTGSLFLMIILTAFWGQFYQTYFFFVTDAPDKQAGVFRWQFVLAHIYY
jgi:hypothetical protein